MQEKISAARGCAAFDGVSEVQLQDLASLLLPLDLVAGTTLFREGDEGDGMYVVASGRLSVRRGGQAVASLGPGAIVGDMALLLEAPRVATVIVDEDARLFRMSRDGYVELLESGHPAAFALLRNLARIQCERVIALDERIAQGGTASD
jgi:CRP-like cAMP-binding protein